MGSLVVGLRRQADLAESGPSAAVFEDDVRITELFSDLGLLSYFGLTKRRNDEMP